MMEREMAQKPSSSLVSQRMAKLETRQNTMTYEGRQKTVNLYAGLKEPE